MIEISILMPAKNASDFISDCILSIQKQIFKNWELIVVDDFSSDSTASIVDDFSKKDARIKLLKNKNHGIISALETAFNISTGQYVTRMDADDVMPENKLQVFYNKIMENPTCVVTGKVKYFSDQPVSDGYLRYESWINSLSTNAGFYSSIYRECIVASPNWIVSRVCFENHFAFSELNYPEDYDMVFNWYKNGYKIVCVEAITHLWREHESRTSRTHQAYQQEAFFKLKTSWFIKLETKNHEQIQVIGSGKKGKLVVKELIESGVEFDWFEFKADKTNTEIRDKKIHSVFDLKRNVKTILTVWPTSQKTQMEILKFCADYGFIFGKSIWLF